LLGSTDSKTIKTVKRDFLESPIAKKKKWKQRNAAAIYSNIIQRGNYKAIYIHIYIFGLAGIAIISLQP